MVEPQLSALKSNEVISKAMELSKSPIANVLGFTSETQGALALAQKVANNPLFDLAKKSSVTAFRDLGIRKDVTTSQW